MTDADLFARLERFYDEVPRASTRVETFGGLVLFVREGDGYPLYARPAPDRSTPATVEDFAAVRARQRALGVPEAFEWVHDMDPDLLGVARAAGLAVLLAPLMVLDHRAPVASARFSDVPVELLDPEAVTFPADVAARRAVSAVGFAAPGTASGDAGPAERDAVTVPPAAAELAEELHVHRTGRWVSAVARSAADGVLAGGVLQRIGDVAEVAGVATLPAARRKGLGGAVTAALAAHAVESGVRTVFLSAGSEQIGRVYERVGFRRAGTACIAEPA